MLFKFNLLLVIICDIREFLSAFTIYRIFETLQYEKAKEKENEKKFLRLLQ